MAQLTETAGNAGLRSAPAAKVYVDGIPTLWMKASDLSSKAATVDVVAIPGTTINSTQREVLGFITVEPLVIKPSGHALAAEIIVVAPVLLKTQLPVQIATSLSVASAVIKPGSASALSSALATTPDVVFRRVHPNRKSSSIFFAAALRPGLTASYRQRIERAKPRRTAFLIF